MKPENCPAVKVADEIIYRANESSPKHWYDNYDDLHEMPSFQVIGIATNAMSKACLSCGLNKKCDSPMKKSMTEKKKYVESVMFPEATKVVRVDNIDLYKEFDEEYKKNTSPFEDTGYSRR